MLIKTKRVVFSCSMASVDFAWLKDLRKPENMLHEQSTGTVSSQNTCYAQPRASTKMTHGWFKKALCNICITLNEHKTCLLALENCPSLVPEPCGKRSSETPSFLFAILLCEPVLHDICSVTDCHHKSFLRNGVSVFMHYWPLHCAVVEDMEKKII